MATAARKAAKNGRRNGTRNSKRAKPAERRPPRARAAAAVDPEPTGLPLSVPEPTLAARALPPPPERPLPAGRRAIFFDVENTSRAEHIARVISHLAVDRAGRRTEFFAVGNWRVIGHDTARLLARHGAQLVHSAPSVGVRDWSDLRIAVASGVWLAGGRPGDVIEIISDDRAFDAVGDVAASLGVTFQRLSYRSLLGAAAADVPVAPAEADVPGDGDRSRRRRRGRRHERRHDRRPEPARPEHHRAPPPAPPHAPRPAHHAPAHHPPAHAPEAGEGEPHTAPHDELVAVVRELVQASPGRNVTLDTLANALKSRGFARPPGSPRLITRLRRIKELEVSRSGVISLVDGGGTAHRAHEAAAAPAPPPVAADVPAPPTPVDEVEGPEPGNERLPDSQQPHPDDGEPRRRSRRGGRGRRGRRGDGSGDRGQGGRGERSPGRGDRYPDRGQRHGDRSPRYLERGDRVVTPRPEPPREHGRESASAPSWITGQPLA